MTQAQKTNLRMEQLKQQVCRMLQIDELEYASRQFEAGCEYLQAYITEDTEGIAALQRSPVYWAWWRNHWALRDEQFCTGHVSSLSLLLRHQLYTQLHNPQLLATELRPNGIVLQLAYAEMIEQYHQSLHYATHY